MSETIMPWLKNCLSMYSASDNLTEAERNEKFYPTGKRCPQCLAYDVISNKECTKCGWRDRKENVTCDNCGNASWRVPESECPFCAGYKQRCQNCERWGVVNGTCEICHRSFETIDEIGKIIEEIESCDCSNYGYLELNLIWKVESHAIRKREGYADMPYAIYKLISCTAKQIEDDGDNDVDDQEDEWEWE